MLYVTMCCYLIGFNILHFVRSLLRRLYSLLIALLELFIKGEVYRNEKANKAPVQRARGFNYQNRTNHIAIHQHKTFLSRLVNVPRCPFD